MSEEDNPFLGIHETVPEEKISKMKSKSKKSEVKAVENLFKKETKKGNHDPNEKAKLIYAIQSFGENKRLGSYLKSQGHKYDDYTLNKMSVEDLKLELEKQNVSLSHKSNNGMIDIVIKNGLRVGEMVVSNKTPLQINGLTDELYSDDVFLDLVESVKLKNNVPFMTLPVELELALCVCQSALLLHNKNRFQMSIVSETDIEQDIDITNLNKE